MIASLAFAWLAFTVTGTIPNLTPKVTVGGDLQLTPGGPTGLERDLGRTLGRTPSFSIYHEGSVQITR